MDRNDGIYKNLLELVGQTPMVQLNVITKDSLSEVIQGDLKYKVAVNLEAILKDKGSFIDMYLKEGDVLSIPSELETIEITGMVLKPSLVQYDRGLSLKEYVSKSGGFSEGAEKNKIYVAYANGDIKTIKRFLFIKRYPKLTPGAVIFIPKKNIKEKMSTAELLGITTSIATLGILIRTILN